MAGISATPEREGVSAGDILVRGEARCKSLTADVKAGQENQFDFELKD
jgi:hypothetical protein